MAHATSRKSIMRLCLSVAAALVAAGPTLANDSPPTPSIDCTKKANKGKPECQSYGPLTGDEIYNAAYWLAHQGQYAEALALLKQAGDTRDPRLLNETGFV